MQPTTTSHAMQTTTNAVFQWSVFVNRHSIDTAKAVAPNDPDPNPEDWKFLCFCQSEAEAHAEVETLATSHATQSTIPNVLPVWIGQTGPVMPLSDVDSWPVIILSQYATADQIQAAKSALMTIP